jgi:D-alanyl-D-alanine carboxypeptidase
VKGINVKKTIKRIVAVVLGLCLLGSLVACGGSSNTQEETTTEGTAPVETVAFMDGYQPVTNIDSYRDALAADSEDYLLLVNKQFPLGDTYAPASLADIPASLTLGGKALQLETTVAKAAEALIRELHAQGYTDIVMTSAYRDYAYQENLFNYYIDEEMFYHPDWTRAEAEAEVLTYSARPGTSEHQSGLCLDLISATDCVLDESFADLPAYDWLLQNAHCFGFILRYPEGMESITGYSYEPWHYRFVGVSAATAIHDRGITLEQYLSE